jgi:hypothetical protein
VGYALRVRRGRSIRVIVVVLALFAVVGLAASAQGATTPAATAQAVLIDPQGAPVSGTPTAEVPDTPTVTVKNWTSSNDQPLVTLDAGTSTAASDHGISSGSVQLTNVSVFGGEIQLQSLNVAASTATNAVDLTGEGLQVDGSPADIPAVGDSMPLGDWGTLTASYQTTDAGGRTVLGLVVTLSADHGGLASGSSIVLGSITLAAPADSGGGGGGGTGGGGTGGGGGGGNGGSGGGPAPTPDKHHHGHHGTHGAKDHHHGARGHHGHQVVKVHHPRKLPQLGRGLRGRVVEAAAEQIGWPYVWGGESRAEGGFDCSGLVDYAYAAAGHPLSGRPTAAVLWQMGMPITVDQLRPGDLVFLGAPSGEPYHVALYAGHGMVIVASGRGRPIAMEPLDSAPWDGYARIWAPGAGRLLKHAPWLTAAVQDPPKFGLRPDVIAAARASRTPPTDAKPSRTHVQAPAPPPPPDPAAEHGTTLVVLADLRIQLELGMRAVLGLPSA